MRTELPPVGADVITENGRATVLAQEILASQLLVQMEDSRRVMIDATEVLTVLARKSKSRDKAVGDQETPVTESKSSLPAAEEDSGPSADAASDETSTEKK
jgi:hypothetical protein